MGSTQFYDVEPGALLREFEESNGHIKCLGFSLDGTLMFTGAGGCAQVWGLRTSEKVWELACTVQRYYRPMDYL